MYRYSNGQISLADFKQPVGMNLKESNRWVKKAQTIPWPEIEKRCAALFTNRKGNVAKPLRLALGACIIQAEYGYSDEETAGPLCGEKREICRKWQSGSERERGIPPAGSWRTKSAETGRISAIARRMGSVFPARLRGGPRRVKPETRLRTIGMSASAWKWSADSV